MLEHMNRREYGIEILQYTGEATETSGQLQPAGRQRSGVPPEAVDGGSDAS